MFGFVAALVWFFDGARTSWKARQWDAGSHLDHTYDFLTSCFALVSTLILLAAGIMHHIGVNPAPVGAAAAVLFAVFYMIAVPMRIKLESEKRRRRQRSPKEDGRTAG